MTTTGSKKRKSSDNTTVPTKRQKLTDDKPVLNDEWTRTDPKTGDKGRLLRKDTNYQTHYIRRRAYIERKKRKREAAKQAKLGKKKVSKKGVTGSPKTKKKTKNVTIATTAKQESKEDINSDADTDQLSDDDVNVFDDDIDEDTPYHKLTKRFKNQVVVIIGGGRGIGQACAVRFAQEGARIYILDNKRFSETCKAVKLEYADNNVNKKNAVVVKGIRCDATDAKSVQQVFASIIERHGYIDVVVNCIDYHGKPSTYLQQKTHEIAGADFDRIVKVNLYSMFNVCKHVLPLMMDEDYGRIVNLANNSGKHGQAFDMAYSCAKAAIICATKSMAQEYAKSGITINCVAPQYDSYHVGKFRGKKGTGKVVKQIPMGRVCNLEEIATVVAFAASEENAYTTGFCYDVTGGAAYY